MNPAFMLQPLQWQPRTGITPTGDPTYGPGETIYCRFEDKFGIHKIKETGQNLLYKGRIYTIHPVSPGDIVIRNGVKSIVLTVQERTRASGEFAFREVTI